MTLWMACSALNLLSISLSCLKIYREEGYLSPGGVAFLLFWSVALAPGVTMLLAFILYLYVKENYVGPRKSR